MIPIENHEWLKQLLVLRPVAGLLLPTMVAVSKTATDSYLHTGLHRDDKDMVVFQYTISGRGVFEVNGEQHDLTPGRAFCAYVGDERITYRYPSDAHEPWRFIFLNFKDALGSTRALNDRCGFVFDIDPAEILIPTLLEYGQMPEQTIELKAGAGHLFMSSVIAMLTDGSLDDQSQSTTPLRIIRRAIKLIEANLTVPFNAAMLARELHISQEHLNRICRAELGRAPYQCICQSKIHRACEQLKNTPLSISEIALSLGYEPGSHFARLFKRIIGITPSTFRNSASMPLKPF